MSLNIPAIGGFPGLSIHASPDGGLPDVTVGDAQAAPIDSVVNSRPPSVDLGQVPTTFTGPVALPENDPALPVDVEEAEAPTVAQPVTQTVGPGAADVYVAPMSTRWQRFWHKLLCIGCCVPRN